MSTNRVAGDQVGGGRVAVQDGQAGDGAAAEDGMAELVEQLSATVTLPPSGNSSTSRATLTTWYWTRNGFWKPRSFGKRMCNGIWPPSNAAGTFLRAPVPLVPRPAVLPRLPPSPRPTRILSILAPGAGRRWCAFNAMLLTLKRRRSTYSDRQVFVA